MKKQEKKEQYIEFVEIPLYLLTEIIKTYDSNLTIWSREGITINHMLTDIGQFLELAEYLPRSK